MQKVQWGIIGCGDVTEVKSGPAFNKVENSALVAVMRRDAAKAQDYARRHNVPKWYDDAAKLINDDAVNAVYVATPPSSHLQYALAAIEAGKPVYMEKPMTDNYEAARAMAEAAAAKGVKLVVAHYRREQPRFKKVQQLLDEQAIGKVLYARIELCKLPLTQQELAEPKVAWRVDPAIAGGGIFHDLAPHQLDLMHKFFGPVEKVSGVSCNQGGAYAADDMVAGTILFKSRVAFTGVWCFNAPQEKDICEITGTNGAIRFNVFSTNAITVTIDGETTTHTFDDLPHVQQPMIQATVDYFLGRGANPSAAEEGAEVMRLIETMTH
ncbi:MAG TPA: Gfo/Idh/MocA family oxidoreductase [Chitinophagaceae bacterium]|nr:Gfo/Idh/MocA family oxidoreductase [Chitinophagaceae bacterium]